MDSVHRRVGGVPDPARDRRRAVGLTIGAFDVLDLISNGSSKTGGLPCGFGGAVVVAAWMVEAKQNVVENIAPVLTRVFTPCTIVMLLALLAGFAATRSVVDVDRNLLILMDMTLVLEASSRGNRAGRCRGRVSDRPRLQHRPRPTPPVDLPQAAIGPGMAVFSRYSAVLENDGSRMSVRTALQRINELLD